MVGKDDAAVSGGVTEAEDEENCSNFPVNGSKIDDFGVSSTVSSSKSSSDAESSSVSTESSFSEE